MTLEQAVGGVVQHKLVPKDPFRIARGLGGLRQDAAGPTALGAQQRGEAVEPVAFHADTLGHRGQVGAEPQA